MQTIIMNYILVASEVLKPQRKEMYGKQSSFFSKEILQKVNFLNCFLHNCQKLTSFKCHHHPLLCPFTKHWDAFAWNLDAHLINILRIFNDRNDVKRLKDYIKYFVWRKQKVYWLSLTDIFCNFAYLLILENSLHVQVFHKPAYVSKYKYK